jgi:hypothetical protein
VGDCLISNVANRSCQAHIQQKELLQIHPICGLTGIGVPLFKAAARAGAALTVLNAMFFASRSSNQFWTISDMIV